MKKREYQFKMGIDEIEREYRADQQEVKDSDGFLCLETGDYVEVRGEKFGIFGHTVYWLLDIEDDDAAFCPTILPDSKLWAVWPDEGHGGIAHLCHLKKRNKETIIKPTPRHITLEEFEKWKSEPVIHEGTQAAMIRAMGMDPVALGGKVVDGEAFKLDANPEHRGECARCDKPGVWISGAGEILCARHQDEY